MNAPPVNTRESAAPPPRPVVLCVLDGWGERPGGADNAIAATPTRVYDRLLRAHPHALLRTSGSAVGLPEGQMGNSEVGHMNLGGGRVVLQDLPRIDRAIADGSLARNPVLTAFIDKLAVSGGVCHLMGLVSPGGVHSHQDHMLALARLLDGRGIAVAVHAFLDGRDTPPRSAARYVATLTKALAECDDARVVTVSGRYYAMDRDQRWDRTAAAYRCLTEGEGTAAGDPVAAIQDSHDADITDEFMVPHVIGDFSGMADGDGLLMANFRSDRARQILSALVDPGFDGFERARTVEFAARVGMVEYSSSLAGHMTPLFAKQPLVNTLGAVLSVANLRQLRIAETEKYAHVTFFFNGGDEAVLPGEDRILVPSPKVATYDLDPGMSAEEVTSRLVGEINAGTYDFIVVNYANADMVGHTGDMAAAREAVAVLDRCLGRLTGAVEAAGGALLITADHGNIEVMRDPDDGQPYTAHTTNPVPLVLVQAPGAAPLATVRDGRLADVAPTVLALMGLPQPAEMTGRSLLRGGAVAAVRKGAVAGLALLIVLMMAPSLAAEDQPAEKLKRIETQIEQSEHAKRGLDSSLSQLSGEVRALTDQLIKTAAAIRAREENVSASESRLVDLSDQEAAKSSALDRRSGQLADSLAALQRLSRQPNLLLIGRPAETLDSLRSAALLSAVVPELESQAVELGAAVASLKLLRADIGVRRGQLIDDMRGLARERQKIDRLLERKAAKKARLSKAAKAEDRHRAALAREAKDLRALIARLEAQADRDARLAARGPEAGRPFSSLRGALSLPASGRLARRYNQPDGLGLATKGIAIETRRGAQVVAPYDGKVVFAGPFRNYGQLLIISHGEGYHTVLSGLSRIDAEVGEWLLTGEPVGEMGNGAQGGGPGGKPMLYIELRRNGDPINPLIWLAGNQGKVSG